MHSCCLKSPYVLPICIDFLAQETKLLQKHLHDHVFMTEHNAKVFSYCSAQQQSCLKKERLLGSKKCMVVQQKISRGPRLFFPSLCVPRLLVWILLSLHGASKTRKPSPCLKSLKCLLGRLQSCSKGSSIICLVI